MGREGEPGLSAVGNRETVMESQVYGNGTQGSTTVATFYGTGDGPSRQANCILRFIALAATFVAAIVMGVAGETKSILTTTLAAIDFQLKAAGYSQFNYFIAVNAIVCFYSAVSLAMWIVRKGESKNLAFALTMVDLVVVAFLFSGEGSASAMAVLLRRGSSDSLDLYPRVCNVYSKFCGQVSAAIVVSMFAAVAYLALAVLSYLNLYKRSL